MQNRKLKSRLRYESLEPKNLLAANLVADINQLSPHSGNPRDIVAVGQTLFFVAEDENGVELWKSDDAGTQMVKDIVPGSEGSYPHLLTAGESLLFFATNEGTWRSDGTDAGTFLIDSEMREFAAVSGDHVLLIEPFGYYLSDGTAEGLINVVVDEVARDNIDGVAEGALTDHFVVRNGRGPQTLLTRINFDGSFSRWDTSFNKSDLVFPHEDGVFVLQSNGNVSMLSDDGSVETLGLEGVSFDNYLFQQSGNIFYFTSLSNDNATRTLFRSDGSPEGTFAVGEFLADRGSFGAERGSSSVAADNNGGIWFAAVASGGSVNELWFTDGTAEGTRQVNESGSSPHSLTYHGGHLWFVADDDTNVQQLWSSNGTADGTVAITNFSDTTFDPRILGATDQNIVFSIGTQELGVELWKAGNTANSAELIRDIAPGFASSLPGFLTPVDDRFYFAATSPNGRELWQTDLTSDGTLMVLDIADGADTLGSAPNNVVEFRGKKFFTANDGRHGKELWTIDSSGTPQLFKDIELGPAGSHPHELTIVGDTLYFVAQASAHGPELWQSDGTVEGTRLVEDVVPGPTGLGPEQLSVANGELYFLAFNRTEDSTQTTLSLGKLGGENVEFLVQAERSTNLGDLVTLNDQIYFKDAWSRKQVPQTIDENGNAVFVPGFDELSLGGSRMGVVGNYLVSADRSGLWFSDGETGLKRFEIPLNLPDLRFYDQHFTARAFDGLYVGNPSDGKMVSVEQDITDIVPLDPDMHLIFTDNELYVGDPLAIPDQPIATFDRIIPGAVPFDGGVYFAVGSEDGLSDVWMSDGTAEGTTQVTDIGFSTNRTSMALHAVGSDLYLTADDGTHGNELWLIDTPADTRGDLNGDGTQDASDIDALFAAIRNADGQPGFDVNGDGEVNSGDIDYLLIEILDRRWGDANLDGRIGFDDFLSLSESFGSRDATWSQGDFTGDGEVSFADFLLLASAFGESTD